MIWASTPKSTSFSQFQLGVMMLLQILTLAGKEAIFYLTNLTWFQVNILFTSVRCVFKWIRFFTKKQTVFQTSNRQKCIFFYCRSATRHHMTKKNLSEKSFHSKHTSTSPWYTSAKIWNTYTKILIFLSRLFDRESSTVLSGEGGGLACLYI